MCRGRPARVWRGHLALVSRERLARVFACFFFFFLFEATTARQGRDGPGTHGQDAHATQRRGQDARDTRRRDACATRGQDARDTRGKTGTESDFGRLKSESVPDFPRRAYDVQ